jgi:hypothetical protein
MTIIYAIMIAIGFVPFIIALFKMRRIKRMQKDAVKTTATVKQFYTRSIKGMNRVLIEFTIVETGQVIEQEIIVGGMPYAIGDELPLLYEKDNPAKNILDPGKSYIAILIFTLLLAAFMIFACYMIEGSIERGEM